MRIEEPASARQIDRHALAGLAHAARARGQTAPSDAWLAELVDGSRHVGFAADETQGETLLAVWAGETRSGRRLGALLEVPMAAWLALDEVAVPHVLQRWASELAREELSN